MIARYVSPKQSQSSYTPGVVFGIVMFSSILIRLFTRHDTVAAETIGKYLALSVACAVAFHFLNRLQTLFCRVHIELSDYGITHSMPIRTISAQWAEVKKVKEDKCGATVIAGKGQFVIPKNVVPASSDWQEVPHIDGAASSSYDELVVELRKRVA